MLLNYFKIAFRSLLKFKGYTAINLFGLALGLTAGVLIMLYVLDELSYDKFHAKLDRIYRVETQFVNDKSEEGGSSESNAWGVGSTLKKDYPEVEAVLYTRNANFLLVNYEGKRIRERAHFATPEFFEIFTFPLVEGNAEKALTEPYSVVITETMARKYFNGQQALNKTMTFADTLNFVVTGVMKDIPSNSHIQLDMLISFSTFSTVLNPGFDFNGGWGNINMRNYVLLKENVDVANFKAKAAGIYRQRAGEMLKDWGVDANVVFMPLSRLYLHAKNGNGMGTIGSIDRLYLMSGIAVFVILLACINFVNLTTARSVYRAKEVGLRKVVGSTRQALIRQFLSESFVLTLTALIVGVALAGLLLPLFNQILAKSYTISSLFGLPVVVGVLVLITVVTLLSGYYPALMLSGMKPVEVLKGKLQNSARGVQLRRALVVFQFVISVSLVLGTLIVINQLTFMQKQELGFAKDEIFVVNAARVSSPNANAFETFKNELKSLTIVGDVSITNSIPGNPGWIGQVAYPEGKSGDDAVSVEYMAIDDNYLKTMGLELIAGNDFSREREGQLKDGLILNETAVTMFGWTSPQEAIGKKITSPSTSPEGEVIGVVKDYHQFGLQQKIGPMAMDFAPQRGYMYAIRYKAANTQDLITSVHSLWQKNFPGYDFNYFFLDQDFERQYQAEQRLATVFGLFSVVTILIAVIGLLGLISFMVAARTKEIGVRKVLGADVLSITTLLSKEFVLLVVVANVIAFPLAWYFANEWLSTFATRSPLNPMLFVMTMGIALAITLATISFQTVKAALTDPVKSLRYE
ncbi:MAG TPA: ABC transporter permease [Chryseosolibacter sp.]